MIEALALSLALGAMQAPLAATAQLKTVSQVPPAPVKATTANPAQWKKLVHAALNSPDCVAIPETSLLAWTLTLAIPEINGKAQTYMVQVAGEFLPGNNVRVAGATIASSSFVTDLAAGTITQHTRVFSTDRSGKILSVTDMKSVTKTQPPDAEPVPSPDEEVDVNSPEVATEFDYIVDLMTR